MQKKKCEINTTVEKLGLRFKPWCSAPHLQLNQSMSRSIILSFSALHVAKFSTLPEGLNLIVNLKCIHGKN